MKCSLLVILFIPFLAMAGKDNPSVEKKISKEFAIKTDGRVELDNKYGNIDVAIGPGNQVKLDIVITVSAGSERKAQEALDRIAIMLDEGNNRVSARTEIETLTGWTSWFNIGNTSIEVNYHVIVPADVFLDLTNRYGNIYVETTNRDLNIDLGYGDIRLGDVNGKLKLDMAYSEGTLSQIHDGDLELSYSDLEMEDGKNVVIEMKNTDLQSGTFDVLKMVSSYCDWQAVSVSDLDYTGKYDDVKVDHVNKINAETAFTGISIADLTQEGIFEMRYGELKLEQIHKGFSTINLNTSYTGVKLDFMGDASYTVDADVNYCEIRHSDLKITESIDKTTGATLKASRGSGGGTIYARMNYGDLSIE